MFSELGEILVILCVLQNIVALWSITAWCLPRCLYINLRWFHRKKSVGILNFLKLGNYVVRTWKKFKTFSFFRNMDGGFLEKTSIYFAVELSLENISKWWVSALIPVCALMTQRNAFQWIRLDYTRKPQMHITTSRSIWLNQSILKTLNSFLKAV